MAQLLGLRLMQHGRMPTASQVLSEYTGRDVTEQMISTWCPQCKIPQILGGHTSDTLRTTYLCHLVGCGTLLIVGPASDAGGIPDRGWVVGDYILRNPEMVVVHFGKRDNVLLAGCLNALNPA